MLEDIQCLDNIILAFTLLPDKVIEEFEGNFPYLDVRLKSIYDEIDDGMTV